MKVRATLRPWGRGRRAAKEILRLCTAAAVPEREKRLSRALGGTVDWKHLLDLARFHGVTPLLAHHLTSNGLLDMVPVTYVQLLKQAYHSNLYRNLRLSTELEEVCSGLAQRGIESLTLKGPVMAEMLYGNPGLRRIVDLDLLVRREDLPEAGSFLLARGYHQITPRWNGEHPFHQAPYVKQGQVPVYIELHWSLDDPALLSIAESAVWQRAQPVEIAGKTVRVLSPEDNLLFLANQLSKQDDCWLRTVGDIAVLIKQHEHLDWNYVAGSARSWQMTASLYYALLWARDLLWAPVPAKTMEAVIPPRWQSLLLDLLSGREAFISPSGWHRIRMETLILFRALGMSGRRSMAAVLDRHRSGARTLWLKTAVMALCAFVFALPRNGRYALSRLKSA